MAETRVLAMDDQVGTQTITVHASEIAIINRASTAITLTVPEGTVTIPAGGAFTEKFNFFDSFTVTCSGAEDWSYVVRG